MQPSTGAVRSGSSPSSRIRSRSRSTTGSGSGTAERSAIVYGCCGARKSSSAGATSTNWPPYITTRGRRRGARREVVRDEEVGEPEPLLQVAQQVQDLRAHRDVERRDRLVADDSDGIGRERARDRDPLALPARELERPALAEVGGRARRARAARGRGRPRRARVLAAQQVQRLGDDRVDRHHRVERVAGILEDHLHAAAMLLGAGRRAASPRAAGRRSVTAPAVCRRQPEAAAGRRSTCPSRTRRRARATRRAGSRTRRRRPRAGSAG